MSLKRITSAASASVPNLALVNRRLSMLSNDERNGETTAQLRARLRGERFPETPVGADLSESSTLAPTPTHRTARTAGPRVSFPDAFSGSDTDSLEDIESRDGIDTPTTVNWSGVNTPGMTNATTRTDVGSLVHVDSHVVMFRKETIRKWATYPQKGYETTTRYFYEEIDSHWTSALIIACFFISGIVDSVSYQTYSTFTSLQTGNTIFIALRLSNRPASKHPFAYTKSIMSVVCYCFGGLFFNILHRVPTQLSNPKVRLHRWTLFTSFIVQSALLLASAGISQSGYTSTRPFRSGDFSSGSPRHPEDFDNYLDLLPIGMLAFEAAGQVCLSRVLMVNDLPTIVVSTLYHDFISDALSWPKSWKAKKSKREWLISQKKQVRRILCILALFAGAVVAGFVYASKGSMPACLWMAAGIKVIISICWCCWKKKVVTETVVKREPAPPGMVSPPLEMIQGDAPPPLHPANPAPWIALN